MVTASYYREQARILISRAASATDPAAAERLRQRAREYQMLAEDLEDPPPPPPREAAREVVQQQQQNQPKQRDDKE